MFSVFKITDLGSGYSIVQPPAGLLPEINKRIKSYSDDDGTLNSNTWAGIFVLACLHKDSVPIISSIIPNGSTPTIREAFCKLSDAEFKAVVEEFLFSIDRDTLEAWFEAIDKSNYITKKATDEVKND